MKIALCIPAYGDPKAQFTECALHMVAHSMIERPGLHITPIMVRACQRIEWAREDLARQAFRWADYLLWLDDDHTFPPDTLLRLIDRGLPFVGISARKRDPRVVIPTALIRNPATGKMEPVPPKPDGLEPVDILGFGVTLIRGEVFRALPRPWFKWGPTCEDGYFCEQACRAGFTPHVDHSLSREVGHIAESVLKLP